MSKEKARIIAVYNGVPKGYIKSVSYKNGTFKTTKDKKDAKGYATKDHIQGDIDFLTKHYFGRGYIFIYD